jgi:hypothetical protein
MEEAERERVARPETEMEKFPASRLNGTPRKKTRKVWQLALSGIAGSVVFVVVLLGVIQATGAPPGGVLTGRGAFFASLVSHAVTGALVTWLQFFCLGGCLGFVFALVGAFRRRRSWATPLLSIAAVVGAIIGIFAIEKLEDWLGSVSPGVWDGTTWQPPFWDAAALWGMVATVGTLLLVTAPDFVRGLWRWSNGGSFGNGVVWFQIPLYVIATAFVVAGCLLFIVAMLGLSVGFLAGAKGVSYWVLRWAPWAFWITLAISIFILGPFALIPPVRFVAAVGFMIASFVFGVIMWCWGFAITYVAWGWVGVIIGLFVAGVGIVPVAMLASLLHGEWEALIGFAVLIVLTFGLRMLSVWLEHKIDQRAGERFSI